MSEIMDTAETGPESLDAVGDEGLEKLGGKVASFFKAAIAKADKMLKPYGYRVSVRVDLHPVDQESKSQS
jgi:hypothetical protein